MGKAKDGCTGPIKQLEQRSSRPATASKLLGVLISSIQEARESPPDFPFAETYQAQLAAYRCVWAN